MVDPEYSSQREKRVTLRVGFKISECQADFLETTPWLLAAWDTTFS